jgi:hypothetical protein
MDRRKFLDVAPLYYAGAIYGFLREKEDAVSEEEILEAYAGSFQDAFYKYFQKELLFAKAIQWLSEKGLLDIVEDDFGPPLFRKGSQPVQSLWEIVTQDPTGPLAKFSIANWNSDWIRAALKRLNQTYDELGIEPEDFEAPDREWEPLPLERNGPALRDAIARIDELVENVRADNGYAANVPEERAYVLESLTTASRVLKNERQTSIPFIRTYIIEPISRVITRFKDGILGAAAEGARAAIVQYVKEHAPAWAETIIRHLIS